MKLANLIKDARNKKGWTQKRLADEIGVTQSLIAKIEAGAAVPSYERCIALANSLGINADELWEHVEKARKETHQARLRSRGKNVYADFGKPVAIRESQEISPFVQAEADTIAQDINTDPDLQKAFHYLKTALANSQMRETVLNTLETFAWRAGKSSDE